MLGGMIGYVLWFACKAVHDKQLLAKVWNNLKKEKNLELAANCSSSSYKEVKGSKPFRSIVKGLS